MYRLILIIAAVFLASMAQAATLEIPTPNTTHSGIGVISGWKCEANGPLTVRFDGGNAIPLPYGSERGDTRKPDGPCDEVNTGFVAIMNWSNLGDGQHTAVAYDNGVEFDRVTFWVVTTGENFLRDAHGTCRIADFPSPGETATFTWTESTQHLELTELETTVAPPPTDRDNWFIGEEPCVQELREWCNPSMETEAECLLRSKIACTLAGELEKPLLQYAGEEPGLVCTFSKGTIEYNCRYGNMLPEGEEPSLTAETGFSPVGGSRGGMSFRLGSNWRDATCHSLLCHHFLEEFWTTPKDREQQIKWEIEVRRRQGNDRDHTFPGSDAWHPEYNYKYCIAVCTSIADFPVVGENLPAGP